MKEQPLKILALTFLMVATATGAQTLNWASLTGSQIVDSQGAPLDNSFLFELGAFDAGFVPNESNLGLWDTKWHVFQSATYSYSVEDGGYFTGTENLQDVTNYATLFQGMAAFVWIRNSSSTEYFIATASAKPGVAEWKFPDLDPDCCTNGEVTTWSVGNLETDSPIWGSQLDQHGAGVHDPTGGPFDIQTHQVPEPSAPLLALIACGLCLVRRRKQA